MLHHMYVAVAYLVVRQGGVAERSGCTAQVARTCVSVGTQPSGVDIVPYLHGDTIVVMSMAYYID